MIAHKVLVAKLTCVQVVFSVVAVPFVIGLFNSLASQLIDIHYDSKNTGTDFFPEQEDPDFFEPFQPPEDNNADQYRPGDWRLDGGQGWHWNDDGSWDWDQTGYDWNQQRGDWNNWGNGDDYDFGYEWKQQQQQWEEDWNKTKESVEEGWQWLEDKWDDAWDTGIEIEEEDFVPLPPPQEPELMPAPEAIPEPTPTPVDDEPVPEHKPHHHYNEEEQVITPDSEESHHMIQRIAEEGQVLIEDLHRHGGRHHGDKNPPKPDENPLPPTPQPPKPDNESNSNTRARKHKDDPLDEIDRYLDNMTASDAKRQARSWVFAVVVILTVISLSMLVIFQAVWILLVRKAQVSQTYLEDKFMGVEVPQRAASAANSAIPTVPQSAPQAPVYRYNPANNTGSINSNNNML